MSTLCGVLDIAECKLETYVLLLFASLPGALEPTRLPVTERCLEREPS